MLDAAGGWCDGHHCGLAYGVPVPNEVLFVALTAELPVAADVKCEGCGAAAACDGECRTCKLHFARGRAYKSWLAAALERGQSVAADELDRVECEICRGALRRSRAAMQAAVRKVMLAKGDPDLRERLMRAAQPASAVTADATGPGGAPANQLTLSPALDAGYCAACQRGVVSGRLFAGRAAYARAVSAVAALRSCQDLNCQMCCLSAILDGECACCNRRFSAGLFCPMVVKQRP